MENQTLIGIDRREMEMLWDMTDDSPGHTQSMHLHMIIREAYAKWRLDNPEVYLPGPPVS